jgi:hypothetical protein
MNGVRSPTRDRRRRPLGDAGESVGAFEMRTRRCGRGGRSHESSGLLHQGGRRGISEAHSLIAAEEAGFPVNAMCRVLNVSRTGFKNSE